ncbi:NF-kappa-B inhibitor zeta, partial [Lonchura striata]
MGVRVKMPVRELLRKIRLSKGLDPAPGKSKQSTGQTPRGLEDLDILVEVLQEDLKESQLREEPRHPVPDGIWQGFSPELQSCRLLHKAVAQGRRALTFALAQRFASLNKIDEKDAEKRTALHLAAEKNQHLMVSDLISLGANVNEQDSSGKTPLHLCAENGYLRVLEVNWVLSLGQTRFGGGKGIFGTAKGQESPGYSSFQVLKSCKNSGVFALGKPGRALTSPWVFPAGLTPLHCAALAHTVLVAESQRDSGRFLGLRRAQILEGILCLLQMGAKPQLQ